MIMSNTSEIIDMELEAVKAIYLDDIRIDTDNASNNEFIANIFVDIYPSTADNKSHQFVKLSLNMNLPQTYPNDLPVFEFHNIRGLNDEKIEKIREELEMDCKEKKGDIMVYDVIEKCRELLTSFNFPVGNRCAICLYDFTIDDQIIKNECFHHLHCRCLADYIVSIKNSLKPNQGTDTNRCCDSLSDIQCPVCRNNVDISHISDNIDPDKYALPQLSNQPLEDEMVMIEEAKQNVRKFNEIYEKQLQNGGIIDVEAEKNKFFIRISEDSNENNNEGNNEGNNEAAS